MYVYVCVYERERKRRNQICILKHIIQLLFFKYLSVFTYVEKKLVKCVIDQVKKDGDSERNAKGWKEMDRFRKY